MNQEFNFREVYEKAPAVIEQFEETWNKSHTVLEQASEVLKKVNMPTATKLFEALDATLRNHEAVNRKYLGEESDAVTEATVYGVKDSAVKMLKMAGEL